MNGIKRLEFPSVESTWRDLQERIQKEFGIPVSKQRLSLQPLSRPRFVTAESFHSFALLGFKHGDMLYLELPAESHSVGSTPSVSAFRLTSRCTHGPKGRCMHCVDEIVSFWAYLL